MTTTASASASNSGELKSRKMAKIDKIDWGDFKAYLNKNEQWLAKKDIPVYMSSLIAFSSGQLEALCLLESMLSMTIIK